MMGTTVARQLAKQNGELLVTKNPSISSMRELIKEYNFLVEHGVTSGTQFQALENRFNEKIKETDEELKQLDNRLARLHKIEGALMTLEVAPENSFTAIQVLQELNIPTETELTDIQQRIQQYQIEKEALQEFFEDTLKQYTNYQEIKDTICSREAAIQKHSTNEKSLT